MKQCKEKLVTTDTNQTITGFKAFNNGSGNIRSNIDIITDEDVGNDEYSKWAGSLQFKKGDSFVGHFEAFKDSNGGSTAQITAHNIVDGVDSYSTIRAVMCSDGTTYATAPNTPAGAPDNAIVTKGYITGLGSTPAMPGYYACPRDAIKSNVWNLAEKNLLVTILCNKDIQGWIYVNNSASDTNMAIASACVSPGSGGVSCAQAFIRKGIYFKGIFNNSGWFDELMG